MSFTLKQNRGQYYHLHDHEGRRLNLSKGSLGEFCYGVMVLGGEIIQLWPFNWHYNRCSVLPVVAMTPEARDRFEKETGFKLVDPPRVSVC